VNTYRDQAEAWLAQDPDPVTRAELRALLASATPAASATSAAEAALAERFATKLEFGTAGLRGALGAGPNRMNRVTVMRAAGGLAARLLTEHPSPDRPSPDRPSPDRPSPEHPERSPGVVIGYDARHGSKRFALDTAAVLTGAGLTAWLLPGPLPTPVLAFAVRYLGASAGVMVTASHNPPQDNGYKIYWHDGAQIVPPLDAEISAAIDAVGRVDHLPLSDTWIPLDQQITDAYLHAITVDSWRFPHPEGSPVRDTPRVNGVGRSTRRTFSGGTPVSRPSRRGAWAESVTIIRQSV
jgi:phosphomannomutase